MTEPRCRIGYELVIPAGYRGFKDPEETILIDSQDKEDVYYLFHVFIDDPDVKIYVCYHDGSKKQIVLQEMNNNVCSH